MRRVLGMIDHGRSPTHARLRQCWEYVRRQHPHIEFVEQPAEGRSHAENMELLYARARERGDLVLLTELDFLPELDSDWFPEPPEEGVLGVRYAQRTPLGNVYQFRSIPGAWWLLIQPEKVPRRLQFGGSRDPCTELTNCARELQEGRPDPLGSLGLYYEGRGTHLFWSRHYGDPPNRTVAGFLVRDIVERSNAAIDEWRRIHGI